MSNNAQFVEDWNLIFNYKIKENDLQKPTENFLFNVLVDFLKKFNMDIAPMLNLQNSINSEMRRAFKIKFCTYIDHIYKVSCADGNFLFYDLIKPSPKKTTHMLKILLNYFLYVEMLQKETVGIVQSKTKELDRILDKKTKHQLDIETFKMSLEEINGKINHCNEELPTITEQIETLTSKEKNQADKIAQLQDTVKNYDAIFSQLKCKEEELRCDVVSEEEVKSLAANKSLLEKAISEQEDIKKTTLADTEERKKLIDKMEPAIEKIELAMKSYLVEDLNPLKNMKSKLQQISQDFAAQQALNDKKRNSIESKMEVVNKSEKILLQKKDILSSTKEKAESEISQIERDIENESKLAVYLENELHGVEQVFQEEDNYGDFLLRSVQLVVDNLCKRALS